MQVVRRQGRRGGNGTEEQKQDVLMACKVRDQVVLHLMRLRAKITFVSTGKQVSRLSGVKHTDRGVKAAQASGISRSRLAAKKAHLLNIFHPGEPAGICTFQ